MAADREVDLLLVGGGVAAARCARTLRRHGFDGSILLVGEEDRIPYNRPPLSKELLRDDLPDELLDAEPPSWYARREIAVQTGARVERIDLAAARATLADGSSIRFERLLLSTGAAVRRLTVPGAESTLTLRTASDARRLRDAALAAAGAEVVVVGGSFIGLEVASGLASLGLRPTVVEATAALWAGVLGAELAGWAAARLEGIGVRIRLGQRPSRFVNGGVEVGDDRLAAAFAVVGIGVSPRTDLASDAGLRVDDGVVVDAGQRTSDARVWAAGDVARTDGSPRIEHWHAAREAGERAALSMLGLPVPPAPAPWIFSEIAGIALDVFGVAPEWDEERWIRDDLLAYLQAGRVVQLAVIGSAVAPERARSLVAETPTIARLEHSLGGRNATA